jgi:hypothetical protein
VRIDAGHAVGELVKVRLADDDAPFLSQAANHRCILCGRFAREDHRARRRHHTGDVDEVLDGDHCAAALLR